LAILKDIKSTSWQVSTTGAGYISEGLEDVRQCIDVLLRTQKGTDPLRPEFGSDIYQHIDKPVNSVVANVKRAIISALEMYEKRVSVVSVKHAVNVSTIDFFITYKLIDNDMIDQLQLYLSDGGFVVTPARPGGLVVEAIVPANGILQLKVAFTANGSPVLPVPPSFGFANSTIMFAWILENWGSFGKWYLLPGKLIVYLNNNITAATLEVTIQTIYRYESVIPALESGQIFQLQLNTDDESSITGTVPGPMGNLLAYAIANFSDFGTWVIESENGVGDFSIEDFDFNDFSVYSFLYKLVLYSDTLSDGGVTVTAI